MLKTDTMPRSAWQKIQTYLNVLNHVMISIVAVYMTFLCYNAGNRAISWHAWLCTLGYQLLMTQSILAFYSENVWSKEHKRQTQKKLHWVLQAVGSSAAIVGMIVEYIGRSQKLKSHFSSTHSIIGLIAGIWTLTGMFNGIFALWAVELKKYFRPIYLKLAHNLNGLIAFVLGMTSLYFGYDKGFMKLNSREDIRLWLQALAIITILLSLVGAIRSSLHLIRVAFFK
ncbi:cytochrome b561 domain-containing protein 2-like [Contarinia nasturtii]|uniref:cytochrome b561 domain-containing protein 2-like n=1 Tax=Contarinia nasturtii TaxID=265458 RepID=UPI0012D39BDF|nr:cytochrome b561 domain-containing protein 2-like [Contarinia nasturtii]